MRKRELQDSLDIVNFDLRHEQRCRGDAQERANDLAEEKRDLVKAVELLADRLGIRENYLIEDAWDGYQMIFDADNLVQDLLEEQKHGEKLLENEERRTRLSKPSKGSPEK
jgi:hypothetical protein